MLDQLSSLGLSSICNIVAAIKIAKRQQLGSADAIMTVATDGAEMYATERHKAIAQQFGGRFTSANAAEAFTEHVLGASDDNLLELTEQDRRRIFNLGYFTWVEQQGVSFGEFVARRDQQFWRDLQSRLPRWDEMIAQFNREAAAPGRARMTDRRAAHESTMVCAGCGADATGVYPFRCPRATGSDDVDHVLTRVLNPEWTRFPSDSDRNPFVRYRGLLHSFHVARAHGMPDEAYVSLVRALDESIARVDGRGFGETPFGRDAALSAQLGFSERGGVWVKDETGNVSGSHKGRHLAGIMIYLQVLERIGLVAPPLRAARDCELRECRARRRRRRARGGSGTPRVHPAGCARVSGPPAARTGCVPDDLRAPARRLR